MGKLKKLLCRQQLTVMFALVIFLFMFFAMLLVFLGAFALFRLGLIHTDRPVGAVLFLFALVRVPLKIGNINSAWLSSVRNFLLTFHGGEV